VGAVGGLLGIGGGNSGTGYSTPSGTNSGQLQTAYTNANNAVANQNQVYNQFQNIAAGQGPNPAQAMLNQATGQNVAQQGALQAGQRGAAQNVGLIARQAGQQGMQAQQQAAGQGASMQAQQQLGALGQAGQTATGITAAQQGEQSILQGANSANNNIQGQLANTSMQGQQGLLGGIGNAVGSITGLFAQGGPVQKMANGGGFDTMQGASVQPMQPAVGPQSMFAQSLSGGPTTPIFGSSAPKAMFGGNKKTAKPVATSSPTVGSGNSPLSISDQNAAMAAGPGDMSISAQNAAQMSGPSGSVEDPNTVNPSQVQSVDSVGGIDPSETDQTFVQAAAGGNVGSKLKKGGHVPGKPKVKGNSYSNDTVKALLSPGEVVIPKSVMESSDPIRGAAQFVQAVMSKKGKR
jgi:hypothetical protein